MKNYTYVFTDSHSGGPISERDVTRIYEDILLQFHYPACQMNETLNPEEKRDILIDEERFVKSKLSANFHVHKIPRILYDLFTIYFCISERANVAFERYSIDCGSVRNFEDYKKKAKKIHEKIKPLFLEINNFILTSLRDNIMIDGLVILLRDLDGYNTQQYIVLLKELLKVMKSRYQFGSTYLTQSFYKKVPTTFTYLKRYKQFLKPNIIHIHTQQDIRRAISIRDATLNDEFEPEYRIIFNCLIYYFRNEMLKIHRKHLDWAQAKREQDEYIRDNVDPLFDDTSNDTTVANAIEFGYEFNNTSSGTIGPFIKDLNEDLIETVLVSEIADDEFLKNLKQEVKQVKKEDKKKLKEEKSAKSLKRKRPIPIVVIDLTEEGEGGIIIPVPEKPSNSNSFNSISNSSTKNRIMRSNVKANTRRLMKRPDREKFYLYRGAENRYELKDDLIDVETQTSEMRKVFFEIQNFESPVDDTKPHTPNPHYNAALGTHPIHNPQTIPPNYGYSISFNTSIFNGCFADYSACTYHFMNEKSKNVFRDTLDKEDIYKNKYLLSKFFYGDDSIEDNLFFVPPLIPLAQLVCQGELWHVRSKIYSGSDVIDIQNFFGRDCYTKDFYELHNDLRDDRGQPREYPFPDFLSSNYNREKMKLAFKHFMKMRRFTILQNAQKKYLKAFIKTRQTSSKQKDRQVKKRKKKSKKN